MQRFCGSANGEEEYYGADQKEAEHLGPEDIDPDPFQKDTADDDEVVAERVQERQPLDGFRHVFDGKGEPGEEHGRKDEEEGTHHRLLLGLAYGGDEEPEAEGAHEEKGGGAEQEEEASPNGNPEPEVCHGRDHGNVDKPDQDERDGLTGMNSAFVMGVAMICSMVPISFSRTTAMLDRSMVMMSTMLAMTAGT